MSRFTVRLSGPDIDVWIDDAQQFVATEWFLSGETRHGVLWAPQTNASGTYDEFSVAPLETSTAIVLDAPGTQLLREGTFVAIPGAATDPLGQPLTYSATGLPDGLTMNATTGQITGELSQNSATLYNVVVRAQTSLTRYTQRASVWMVQCPANDYSVSPMYRTVRAADNAELEYSVQAPTPCPWMAHTNSDWFGVENDGLPDWGSGTFQVVTSNNSSPSPRVGGLTAAGYTMLVVQNGENMDDRQCTAFGGESILESGPDGASSLTVSFTAHVEGSEEILCGWNATVSVPWMHLVGNTTGFGAGQVTFSVDANVSTVERAGYLVINTREITLQQLSDSQTCPITVSPLFNVSSENQTISATVTAPNGCGWELVNLSPDMLTFDTMTNAGGTRTFDISVQNNTTASSRIGAISVQRQHLAQATITITQAPPSVEEPPPVCGTDCEPTDTRLLYYHADAIGSVRLITDANGNEFARYDFQPTGQEVGNNDTAPWNRVRFGGKERDLETKSSGLDALDYFGARDYQSQTGRFSAVDPILDMKSASIDPQRWNRYAYARNNPLRFVDPDGRYDFDCSYSPSDCDALRQRFEDAQRDALNSRYSEVRKAARAYGKPGDSNGVVVSVLTLPGRDGMSPLEGAGPGYTVHVYLSNSLTGLDFEQLLVHEGSHVFDALQFIESAFDPSKNPTRGKGEFDAYRTGALVKPYTRETLCGGASCSFSFGPNDTSTIQRFLQQGDRTGPFLNVPMYPTR